MWKSAAVWFPIMDTEVWANDHGWHEALITLCLIADSGLRTTSTAWTAPSSTKHSASGLCLKKCSKVGLWGISGCVKQKQQFRKHRDIHFFSLSDHIKIRNSKVPVVNWRQREREIERNKGGKAGALTSQETDGLPYTGGWESGRKGEKERGGGWM